MELQPLSALRVEDYDENFPVHSLRTCEVPAFDLRVDDLLVVLPGTRIPTDGVLVGREGAGDDASDRLRACFLDRKSVV